MNIYVRRSKGKGRGVFAGEAIKKGQIIERCPVLPVPAKQGDQCGKMIINNYFFAWGKKGKHYCLALGYGSLYNHSFHANATYLWRTNQEEIHFRALRDIQPKEEITIDYGWESDSYHFLS